MIRTIIQIDKDKCDGCGLCVSACHEGALGLRNGKAVLLRDDYCDGMGDCLPACPAGAISFIEREAAAYDEAAVQANMAKAHGEESTHRHAQKEGAPAHQCPSAKWMSLLDQPMPSTENQGSSTQNAHATCLASELANWPVQIKLAPTSAPYLNGCDLLIAADCTAFAYANFHADFMRNRVTLIGCPKLDAIDYAEKLAAIVALNDIRSVTVLRMQVPCCGGIEMATKRAVAATGKNVPVDVVTISTRGEIL